jgi:outer membrane protein OmpA-like peptidoglycan-associated protein
MRTAYSKALLSIGLMSVSVAALADEPKKTPPQEPAGFVTGAIIGGFAAGPIGAVVGAGVGTWLGNRVHRAGDAKKAEAEVAVLQNDKSQLQAEKGVLIVEKSDLSATNQALTSRLEQLSHSVAAAQSAKEAQAQDEAVKILDGLQGDVLFRTGSADMTPEMAQSIRILAQAVAKSPGLKVRVDGYADSRGTVDTNLHLSAARADAVRDVFLAAGVDDEALEINAFGKSQSTAADADGYALERRVRLTLQAQDAGAVARTQPGPTDPGTPDVAADNDTK